MSELPFKLKRHSPGDKWLEITGPDQLEIRVDFDDVDTETVLEAAQKMVRVLNHHWGHTRRHVSEFIEG
jgi:hypothetical protein